MKVIINGVGGRMGQNLLKAAYNDLKTRIVGATEIPGHTLLGKDISVILGCSDLGVAVVDDLNSIVKEADVMIDFNSPEATLEHMRTAHENNTRIVIGTTGFIDSQLREIETLAQDIPCVLAPNMGIGINLMLDIASEVAKVLGEDFEVEIMEMHHNQKKDAPSGTAVKLAEVISEALHRTLPEVAVYGRKGITGARTHSEIGLHAIRGGNIIGEHTVYFIGKSERLELTHRADNRMAFAQGALRAAKFLMTAEPDLYDMRDVLRLRGE